MMRAMRRSAKYLMFILALAFVAWLALDYSGLVGQRTGSVGDVVAKVNGTEIRLQTFNEAVRQAQEQRRAAGQPLPYTLEAQEELRDLVFEQLVQQVLLRQEYERRGISVSAEEIREAARTMPLPELMEAEIFQTEGQFDLTKYQTYLTSVADEPFRLALEQRYRDELPMIELYRQLASGVHVSDSELWQRYRDRHDSVSVRLLRIRPQAVVSDASVPVTDQELEAHYRQHREAFTQPARAYLSYVAINWQVTPDDSAASLERAREVRQSLLDGADFAAVARRESADSTSRREGGDLGWLQRGRTVEPFDRALFDLRPGAISEVVTTPFGYHIVRVDTAAADSVKARHILIPIGLADERLRRVEARADSLDRLAAEQTDGAVLDDAAAALGLELGTLSVAEGGRAMTPAGPVPDASIWAFTARPGETSHVVEAPNGFYVFRLDSLRAEGVPPLAAVANDVTRAVQLEKKREAAREVAAAVRDRLQAGASLEEAAAAEGLTTVATEPFTRVDPPPQLFSEPQVIGAAFGLGVGETAGPIETDGGVYFLELVSRQLAERTEWEAQKGVQRQIVTQQLRQQRITATIQALRSAADVVDRRREIERAQRALADRQPVGPLGF